MVQELKVVSISQWLSIHSCAATGCPRLTVDELLTCSELPVEKILDLIHQLYCQHAHQVKAKTVEVVLVGPVEDAVGNVFGYHWSLAGQIVTTTRAIGKLTILGAIEVIRHGLL